MYRMTRSFLPIGQGAFYCEQFELNYSNDKVNVVYDCGSSTNLKLLKNQIEENFKKGEIIHAVFISHLDQDHINGIPYLLQYCNVKKIFFPLLTKANAKYMALGNAILYGNTVQLFANEFVDNINGVFGKYEIENPPQIYGVRENDEDDQDNDYISFQGERVNSGENVAHIIFDDNKNDYIFDKWVYIPYNFRQKSKIEELQNELNRLFNRNLNNEDIQKIWESENKDDQKKIKEAYKNVSGTLNTNSMTLYSGAKEIASSFGKVCCCHNHINMHYCNYNLKNSGCLYLGDYDALGKFKFRDLTNAYGKYLYDVSCIQVPHHGSKHNYNTRLADLDAFFVISAGKYNRFCHPDSLVLKDILLKGKIPFVVTEDMHSKLTICVYF